MDRHSLKLGPGTERGEVGTETPGTLFPIEVSLAQEYMFYV